MLRPFFLGGTGLQTCILVVVHTAECAHYLMLDIFI